MPAVLELEFPGRVFVINSALRTVQEEARHHRFRETGGVLLGYRTDENDVVITEVTGPGPRALHGWRSFEPDTTYFQERLNAIYRRTQGTISYVGDWHTHPYGSVRPSHLDLRSMLHLAQSADRRLQEPLLWIYRPAGQLLGWKWEDLHGVWVLDSDRTAWQHTMLRQLERLPGA